MKKLIGSTLVVLMLMFSFAGGDLQIPKNLTKADLYRYVKDLENKLADMEKKQCGTQNPKPIPHKSVVANLIPSVAIAINSTNSQLDVFLYQAKQILAQKLIQSGKYEVLNLKIQENIWNLLGRNVTKLDADSLGFLENKPDILICLSLNQTTAKSAYDGQILSLSLQAKALDLHPGRYLVYSILDTPELRISVPTNQIILKTLAKRLGNNFASKVLATVSPSTKTDLYVVGFDYSVFKRLYQTLQVTCRLTRSDFSVGNIDKVGKLTISPNGPINLNFVITDFLNNLGHCHFKIVSRNGKILVIK